MLTFDDVLDHLRRRLDGPLPGRAAQYRMAPVFRRDDELARVEGKPCREAAVLALLHPLQEDDAPALVLTVRPPDMAHHAGQIAFPGGRREPGESLVDTALREAAEEVALDPRRVELLAPLTPLYIPPSNFCVYPFLGAVPDFPELHPADAEVAQILHTPLPQLLHPETRREEPWTLRGERVVVPFYAIDGHKVWGATAMMLAEMLALFDDGLGHQPDPSSASATS